MNSMNNIFDIDFISDTSVIKDFQHCNFIEIKVHIYYTRLLQNCYRVSNQFLYYRIIIPSEYPINFYTTELLCLYTIKLLLSIQSISIHLKTNFHKIVKPLLR